MNCSDCNYITFCKNVEEFSAMKAEAEESKNSRPDVPASVVVKCDNFELSKSVLTRA